MKKPLVLYVQKYTDGLGESFTGYTPRKESIVGRIFQHFGCDDPRVHLTIDGVDFEAPGGMTYVQARTWLVKQIESILGYFVIEMPG